MATHLAAGSCARPNTSYRVHAPIPHRGAQQLGSFWRTCEDYDRAEELYRKAIALDPKQTNACWNLSAILERQRNDIPGAIKAVEEYIRRGNPENDGEQDLARLRRKLERST